MRRRLNRPLAGFLVLLLLSAVLEPSRAAAAIPVFDGANFSQNVLTAVRTAEAILQRIEMIRNQVRQIEWMIDNVRDLEDPTLADLLGVLTTLRRLLSRYTRAALYTVRSLERLVETVYPAPEEASIDLRTDELRRLETTLETAKAVLLATREVAQVLPREEVLVREMEGNLLSTDGLLEAAQAHGLLTAAAAQQLVLLNQQTALRNNLEAVRAAHEISTEAQAAASFNAAIEASRVEVGPYGSFRPLPVIPANYPRN